MMLLVKVQECVEVAMNTRLSNVHPYCLSLDSISLALNSFYANNYLLKLKQRRLVLILCINLSAFTLTNFSTLFTA